MSSRAFFAGSGRLDRRRLLAASVSALSAGGLLLTVAACGDTSGGRNRDTATTVSGVTEVTVNDNYFEPASITVPVGTTITWRWQGQHDHNVVGGLLNSPVQSTGEYAATFATPGTVDYECTLHPGMTGEVIVTEQ